jgi:hypothetical protein
VYVYVCVCVCVCVCTYGCVREYMCTYGCVYVWVRERVCELVGVSSLFSFRVYLIYIYMLLHFLLKMTTVVFASRSRLDLRLRFGWTVGTSSISGVFRPSCVRSGTVLGSASVLAVAHCARRTFST